MGSSHLIYLGTYTRDTPSRGIYAIRLDGDAGVFTSPELVAETANPTWLTLSPDQRFLYAVHASPAQALGFRIESGSARLTPVPTEKWEVGPEASVSPSHLTVDGSGRVLLAANYHEGFVASIPIRPEGALGAVCRIEHHGGSIHPTRQEKPHVHSVTVSPDNRFVIAADLGLDRIYTYALDSAAAKLTSVEPPFVATAPGAGPRHFKFGYEGRHGYVINELNNTLTVFDYDATVGALTPKQTITTLPDDFVANGSIAAEVRIHPNGRFLYGSNRGHDSIAVFSIHPATGELARIEIVKSGGRSPRNFALSPDGKWLVCGHQDTPVLTLFHVDPVTGRLQSTPSTANVPACVCVLFYD